MRKRHEHTKWKRTKICTSSWDCILAFHEIYCSGFELDWIGQISFSWDWTFYTFYTETGQTGHWTCELDWVGQIGHGRVLSLPGGILTSLETHILLF